MSDGNKIYGIDLGTTNSVIAWIDQYGKPEVIPNSDNSSTTPSVVQFESPTNIIVGEIAKESIATDPESIVSFVKREMGTEWTFDIFNHRYTPEEISSFILKRLVQDARMLSHDVKDVVITCPAYFGDNERKATRTACELIGLNTVRILDEPIAGLLGYIDNFDQKRNVLIYDLGGGTFDVAVISVDKVNTRIVCCYGDHRLGGKDWDDRLVSLMTEEFQSKTGVDEMDDDFMATSQPLAERTKHTLSKRDKATVKIASGGYSESIAIRREQFEEATQDLLDRTIFLTNNALKTAKEKGVSKIDQIFLVGGSTRMPIVQKRIEEEFKTSLNCEIQMKEVCNVVAKGAALFGKILQEGKDNLNDNNFDSTNGQEEPPKPISVQTVATKSYGLQARKDGELVVHNLIQRQSPTPVSVNKTYKISDPDALEIELKIFYSNVETEYARPDECQLTSLIHFNLPEGLPSSAQLSVNFFLSEEGVLQVTATETASGKTLQTIVETQGLMTEEEIEAARRAFESYTFE